MAGNIVVSTINGGATGAKNAIINGNFGINQRGVSGTVSLSAGAYGHDRWKAGASGVTYTFATSENVTTLTITAGSLIQVIEGLNLQSGTYTLSWAGTAQGKINSGSYSAAGVTGTATGGTNLNVEFNTGTLSTVQLEKGSTATPFEYRLYGTELALCQRYFEKSYNTDTALGSCPLSLAESNQGAYGFVAINAADAFSYGFVTFKVVKRGTPTITLYNPETGATAQAFGYSTGTSRNCYMRFPSQSSFEIYSDNWAATDGMRVHWAANAEL